MTKRVNGKIVQTYDYEEIKEWASILCMGRPPVLFEGKLNKDQVSQLIAYDTKEYAENFDTFSRMIESTLGELYSKEDIIEGIVIKSGRNLFQIISSEFDLLNEAYKKQHTSRDFYDIVILSLTEFMESYRLPTFKSEHVDEMYIEVISDIFVKFCEEERLNEDFDASYLEAPQYGGIGKLNTKHIKNKEALELMKDPIHEALYRVFLSSLRKYKKPYGLLSESVVEKFNSYVGVINNRLSLDLATMYGELADSVNQPLNESRSKNVAVKALKRRQPNDIDNMRVIASVQNAFLPQQRNLAQGEQNVAIYLTSFQPFTNAQMTNIEQIHSQWNVPVILAAVGGERELRGRDFHPSDEIVKLQMSALSNFNKALIPSFMLLNNWSLKEIFRFARPHYEPLLIMTDAGKKSEMALQLFYEEEIMGGRLNALEELNLGEMENKDKSPGYRAIEDGNGSLFMEITPKAVHNSYDTLINEYRTWEGAIIQQFEPIEYPEIR